MKKIVINSKINQLLSDIATGSPEVAAAAQQTIQAEVDRVIQLAIDHPEILFGESARKLKSKR